MKKQSVISAHMAKIGKRGGKAGKGVPRTGRIARSLIGADKNYSHCRPSARLLIDQNKCPECKKKMKKAFDGKCEIKRCLKCRFRVIKKIF